MGVRSRVHLRVRQRLLTKLDARIPTHKITHRLRFLQSLSATWQPPLECKSLIRRVCLDCHGRGRGFESRRPRHSFQKSRNDLIETSEGAKGPTFALFFGIFAA
jgi:hypothetical protein